MTSTLSSSATTLTNPSDGLAVFVILIGIVLLLAIQFEFAQYLSGKRAQRLSRIVLIGLVPLLIVFSMVVVVRFGQELSTR